MTSVLRRLRVVSGGDAVAARLPVDAAPADARGVRAVRGACFARVLPTPLENARLVAYSPHALALLGLDDAAAAAADPQFVDVVAGNAVLPGAEPVAHCYCGHQFGSFAGQLGDGRAMTLGEVATTRGDRWELQLKGAGLTPFSRQADGRAVLRSSIREFLCSEHMWALGVPTTRAATLIVSDSRVVRDPMYDGNPIEEPCAVVLRLAPTFFRFGSWEIFKPALGYNRPGPSAGVSGLGREMLDVMIDLHFADIARDPALPTPEARYEAFFKEVTVRSARMVADWQLVGFTHGVMNTDNMSILGLTIDYGPFGFMDYYNPRFVPNTTDQHGRYRYEAQPDVVKWNLSKFSEALGFSKVLPLERTEAILRENYNDAFTKHYLTKLGHKVGLQNVMKEDRQLFVDLLNTMERTGADFTNTFRHLARLELDDSGNTALLDYLVGQCCSVRDLKRSNRPKFMRQQLTILEQLREREPDTYMLLTEGKETFLEDELANWEKYERLDKITPEEKREDDRRKWATWLDHYKGRVMKDMTDSKLPADEYLAQRRTLMNSTNPKFVLRNYMAQHAITKADTGDFSEVNRLLNLLTSPFDEHEDLAQFNYDQKRPEEYCEFLLSCSS